MVGPVEKRLRAVCQEISSSVPKQSPSRLAPTPAAVRGARSSPAWQTHAHKPPSECRR